MKIRKYRYLFFLATLFLIVTICFVACERENLPQNTNTTALQKEPVIKNVSIEKAGALFHNLTQTFTLRKYFKSKKDSKIAAKSTKDTLGITIYTDEIKEITLDGYTSYTMRIVKPSTNSAKTTANNTTFYNLTIEDNNGQQNAFVTKYEPTDNWLQNTKQAFEGTVTTMRTDSFIEEGDPTDGETNESSGGGGNYYDSTDGSPYYPTDCNGWVIVNIKEIPYKCSSGEDHWPWDNCNCGTPISPDCTPPGYHQIPYYYCEPYVDNSNTGNTNNNTNNNNQNLGGGGTNGGVGGGGDPDDSSITVVLGPDDECTLSDDIKKFDLNGNCKIDGYEACKMNGFSDEVCDCVNNGGSIKECNTDCAQLNAISNTPLIKTRLNQLKNSSSNFEQGLRINKNPDTGEYVPSDILNNNNGANEIKISPRIYTVAIAHTHPYLSVKYKMFSAPDILKMAEMANRIESNANNIIPLLEITHILIFKNADGDFRTYALRFDDLESIRKLQRIYNDALEVKDFYEKLEEKYTSDTNNISQVNESDIFKQQEHLFTLFKEYELNISLYEAEYDLNGLVNNWKKINKENLKKEPCN